MQNIFKTIAICSCAVAFLSFTKTADAATPPMSITIDGNLNDAAWQHGRAIEAFKTQKGEAPKAATTGKILTDANYLYLAFHCEEPQMAKLQTTKQPRDGSLWTNDCIEIYVAPFADKSTFYHIVADVAGQVYDALNINGKESAQYDLEIISKAQKEEHSWTLEMAIPLSNLGLNNSRAAFMNFCRERKPELELTSWHGWFAQPDSWQRVPLSLNAARNVAIDAADFGQNTPQYGANSASISFTADANAPIKVLLSAQENGRWIVKDSQSAQTIKNREITKIFSLNLSAKEKPNAVRWVIEGNNATLFSLTRQISLPENELVATLQSSYYYANENYGVLRLKTFLSPTTITAAKMQITVKKPNGDVQQFKKFDRVTPVMEVGVNISGWKNGDGAAFVELSDGKKVLAHQRLSIPKRPGPFGQ